MKDTLEARVKRLEDIEAIKQLMSRYCYYIDKLDINVVDENLLEKIVSCFTKDGSVYFGPFSDNKKLQGRDVLWEFFKRVKLSFMIHMVHNAVIEIDGDSAKGFWYYDLPGTRAADQVALWIMGTFDCDMVREEGKWKFKNIMCIFNYITPYGDSEGWTNMSLPAAQRITVP